MLIAVTATLAASVTFVAFKFTDAEPAALVIGQHNERLDEWTAVHMRAEKPLQWKASNDGVRYSVDGPAGPASPFLDTEPSDMPVGRNYSFCSDGGEERSGWSFVILAEDRLVSVVSFAVIMPC